MYVNPEPKRRSPVPRITLLSLLVVLSVWFLRQIIDGKEWARPFDPTPTPTLPAIAYTTQGDIFFAEGQLFSAIEAYEAAIQLEPENDRPYRSAALLSVYVGDTAKALSLAEKAVLLNPGSPENLAGYCQALDWEGLYGQAAEACECAIELDPNYAPGYAYLSEVYADQGLWQPALATAKKATEVDFQSPEAQHNYGYAYEVQGRYKEALEYYENAITLRPNLAPFYISAGQSYYALGQLDLASERFAKAIKLNPANPSGYDQLGQTYFDKGEYNRAVDAIQQAITVDATYSRAWGRLGTIYYLRQNYEAAIRNYPIAVELAEKEFLRQARSIQISTEIEGVAGLEEAIVLQGRFERSQTEGADTLIATISPVTWMHRTLVEDSAETCGHLIARNMQTNIVQVSPNQDIGFSLAFSQTYGSVTLDLNSGVLALNLENMPQVQTPNYQVKMRYRPNKVETVGVLPPSTNSSIDTELPILEKGGAPISYYYGLGLSYVYIDPPQCDNAVPWLLAALNLDVGYYNPAWAGLKICPTEDAPPTPLPTFTPTPEQSAP